MNDQKSSLKLSLKRESKAWRRQILGMLAKLNEAGDERNPNQDFRRRQFLYQIRTLKQKGRIE